MFHSFAIQILPKKVNYAQASDIGYLDPRYNSITWYLWVAEMFGILDDLSL